MGGGGFFVTSFSSGSDPSDPVLEINQVKIVSSAVHVFVLMFIYYIHFEITGDPSNLSRAICIGNHMISSAIWDKSARVNFSKANQIARARRASAICGL